MTQTEASIVWHFLWEETEVRTLCQEDLLESVNASHQICMLTWRKMQQADCNFACDSK